MKNGMRLCRVKDCGHIRLSHNELHDEACAVVSCECTKFRERRYWG